MNYTDELIYTTFNSISWPVRPNATTPTGRPRCGVNEEFRTCGTACEPTCARPGPRPCTLQCIINVCQCKAGYARSAFNVCIPVNSCPPIGELAFCLWYAMKKNTTAGENYVSKRERKTWFAYRSSELNITVYCHHSMYSNPAFQSFFFLV